jgi:uncharacterized protein (TIGR03083 family)
VRFEPAPLGRDRLLAEFDEAWASWHQLGETLPPETWDAPTRLPGWTVKDQLSHIVGTEAMLAGDEAPAATGAEHAHVRNDIGTFNEQWVDAYRSLTGTEVLAAFGEVTARRRAMLADLTDEALAAESWTPAGHATYGRFMQIRLFDTWMHEQDVRAALALPGHAHGIVPDRALTEIRLAMPYVVGKRAGAPNGTTVVFRIDGREIAVAVDGRAALVDDVPGDPTIVVDSDLVTFAAAIGGRDHTARPAVTAGDVTLGDRIVSQLAYTI